MVATHELRNYLPAPATDDSHVEALLAFANGGNVVIYGQERPFGEVRTWSLWRTEPTDDEREAHVVFLQGLMRDPWGGLPHVTDKTGRKRPATALIRLPALGPVARHADHALLPDQDFDTWLAHMNESMMESELVLAAHPNGYAINDFRSFKNVASALTFAMLIVMDTRKPYSKALCRCKYCQRFYLAQRNPKGGPANRTYCSPEHRDDHHNSGKRKSVAKSRKHK